MEYFKSGQEITGLIDYGRNQNQFQIGQLHNFQLVNDQEVVEESSNNKRKTSFTAIEESGGGEESRAKIKFEDKK